MQFEHPGLSPSHACYEHLTSARLAASSDLCLKDCPIFKLVTGAVLAGLHMLQTCCAAVHMSFCASCSPPYPVWVTHSSNGWDSPQVSLVCAPFSITCQMSMFRVPYFCFQGCTALHRVAGHCRQDAGQVVKLLLARGADTKAKDQDVSDQLNMLADRHEQSLVPYFWPHIVLQRSPDQALYLYNASIIA